MLVQLGARVSEDLKRRVKMTAADFGVSQEEVVSLCLWYGLEAVERGGWAERVAAVAEDLPEGFEKMRLLGIVGEKLRKTSTKSPTAG